MQISEIPYTQEDEQRNVALLQEGSETAYTVLLQRNDEVIKHIAHRFKGYFNVDIPLQELEMYAIEGFFLAGRSFNFKTTFIEYAVFYTEQHLFYQVYTEYFLPKLPLKKRVAIQRLYSEVLNHLDSGSGLNYYSAIIEAADSIEMSLNEAVELMIMLSQMSVTKPDECQFMEELDNLKHWVRHKGELKTLCNAPLPLLLMALEANLQKKLGIECAVPFTSICGMFNNLTTPVKQELCIQ